VRAVVFEPNLVTAPVRQASPVQVDDAPVNDRADRVGETSTIGCRTRFLGPTARVVAFESSQHQGEIRRCRCRGLAPPSELATLTITCRESQSSSG
jgi:hypothetical protein